jgi:hypothetical protein
MIRANARSRSSMALLLSGYGGLPFILVFLVVGFLTPSYRTLRDSISFLELTRWGVIQQLNFIFFGLLLVLFSFALRRELKSDKGASLIPFFQGLAGVAVIGDGCFLRPVPHMICDIVAFNSSLCVLFLFAWRVRGDLQWRRWNAGSILTAVAMMICLFLFGLLNHFGGPAGLMEKLATVIKTLWSVALVTRLVSGATLAPAQQIFPNDQTQIVR